MVSSLTALLVVFGLLAALLVWARRLAGNTAAGAALEVLDAVALGSGRAVTVVRSGARYFLVGSTAHSMVLIAELGAADVAASKRAAAPPSGMPGLTDLRARMRSLRNAVLLRNRASVRDGGLVGDSVALRDSVEMRDSVALQTGSLQTESLQTESLQTGSLQTGSLQKTGLPRNNGAADAFGGPAR